MPPRNPRRQVYGDPQGQPPIDWEAMRQAVRAPPAELAARAAWARRWWPIALTFASGLALGAGLTAFIIWRRLH